ncbi:HlyD family type I secretion periplasmic adaptor subunit [Methylomonas rivi]|uniref:Membrane fusion protein (MFP) family protein n=1 Tax=Methylomonas rivi TaxID=2952226 RepID=A0ABT1U848_9GAMM|nr:HlyD family type I secretion periplasmic adaptor subunit [Methylomonas sp. WSC-6]MCQ8129985.1 HlyD family type I secretion periplasmic adaptor subunit [Methylomonas sp. WSC-6]
MTHWLEHLETPTTSGNDKPVRKLGLWLVLAVFGGFGSWAAFAPLSSAALAPGIITVESYRKTVQHLEGGIIRSIGVRDGDQVSKGQMLVELDDTQSRAQLEVLKGQYYIELAKDARLSAQRDELDKVRYPEALTQVNDSRAREAMQVQDQTFQVRKKAHENEIFVYQRQIEQLKAKQKGLRAQQHSLSRLVNSFKGELDDFSQLLSEGYTDKQKLRDVERNLAQNEGRLGEIQSEIAAAELQVAETELKIMQLKKELQREVSKEQGDVQAHLFELQEKIQSLESTVTRTIVTAPEAGMVLGLAVHTLGAVIPPGGRILDIVPQQEKLVVEAQLPIADIDRVKVGQTAEIRFSAFKSRETPKIEGKLITLSADRMVDEHNKESPPYYLARVEVSVEGMESLSRQALELVPGMPAEVLINTGSRTLLQYLTQPLTDSFARSFIED